MLASTSYKVQLIKGIIKYGADQIQVNMWSTAKSGIILDVRAHENIQPVAYIRVPLNGNSKQRKQQAKQAKRQVEEFIHANQTR